MTILRPGEHADELISASLTGDLTYLEQKALDQHLTHCSRCRETLAAFREERRLISGMRHQQPPADMSARVRSGIDSGATGSPAWWQRRSALIAMVGGLGAVAAGLLAVVVLNDLRQGPVAEATTTPLASVVPSISFEPSPVSTIMPTPSAVAGTPEPTPETPAPVVGVKTPVARFTYRIENEQPELHLVQEGTETELNVGPAMAPIDAALSPSGDWLAFRVEGEDSGLVTAYAFRQSDGTLLALDQSGLDSPFSRLNWSEDGRFLAYTHISEDTEADVWILDTQAADPAPVQLTDTGHSFAGSFYGGDDSSAWLWISNAEQSPSTYRVAVPLDGSMPQPGNPADNALTTYPDVFLVVDNREGQFDQGTVMPPTVVFWGGEMTNEGGTGWRFARGGMLYKSSAGVEGDFAPSPNPELQVFDLQMPPDGAAFESGRFAWSPDGDGLAVWQAMWSGTVQGDGFPDEGRVYFTEHLVSEGVKLGSAQALDLGDTEGNRVVHVGLGGGQYLAVTVLTEPGAHSGAYGPTAQLRVITRKLGSTPDDVETSGQNREWVGPAIYSPVLDGEGDGQ